AVLSGAPRASGRETRSSRRNSHLRGARAERKILHILRSLRSMQEEPMFTAAAWMFVVLSGLVVLFQIAVAAGTPWGHLTQGGQRIGVLPTSGRIMAVVSAILVAALAGMVALRVGLLEVGWQEAARPWVWLVVAFSALSVLANAA